MPTIIRTFCVVSCIIAGIYGCIIYYNFRDAKRMIWFSAVCFSFGITICLSMAVQPSLTSASDVGGILDNAYLSFYALTFLCINVYTGFDMPSKYARHHQIFNYATLLMAGVSLLIPFSWCETMLGLLFLMMNCVSIFALHMALIGYKAGKKHRIYQIIAYGSFLVASVISIIFKVVGLDYYEPGIYVCIPFLFFHAVMMTEHYSQSTEKTKKLANSLADTIERINHSDNALMCTQMKADFLYRSLDLISLKCDEDPFTAEDLTVSLSKYLRHTLNFQQLKGIVPLSNEIELTKAYIAIEKERNPKISYEYKFPDPFPDFHVPPLSIQPLVENAISHGFDPDQENPRITITIMPYRDYFHIDVSDNGRGMDEETVASLTESLHDSARIGIYNIHARLIGLFGKGLVIQSAPGVGTSVSFVVPPDAIAYLKEKEAQE